MADEDAYFRMAVSSILTRQLCFSNVFEAASLDEALEVLGENEASVAALFDLSMPGIVAPANLRIVRQCFPQLKIAAISRSRSRRDILLALEAGVHGYVVKSSSVSEFTSALRQILDGSIYVPPSIADISAEEKTAVLSDEEGISVTQLTSRQKQVLELLVAGKSNKEIAMLLGLGAGTVKVHMAAIFRYFGVNTRAAAAVAGARPYPDRSRMIRSK
ncbi:response regulator transcription factor [Roseixanthobacter liquoris]|uniref:response regulator transcription factor n=1 Tax=Roseixanthobacter liquoris TaxID=3119921 RepID=UPI003727352C